MIDKDHSVLTIDGQDAKHAETPRAKDRKSLVSNKNSRASLLEEWSNMTGWHGIADAFFAKTILLKAMWIGVVLLTMLLGINQSVVMIIDYVSEDKWSTSITSKLATNGLPVPTLIVCSLNVYNQSSFTLNGITIDTVVSGSSGNVNVDPDVITIFQSSDGSDPKGHHRLKNKLGQQSPDSQDRESAGAGGFNGGQNVFGGLFQGGQQQNGMGMQNGHSAQNPFGGAAFGQSGQQPNQFGGGTGQQNSFPNMQNGFQPGGLGGDPAGSPQGGRGPMGSGGGGGFGQGGFGQGRIKRETLEKPNKPKPKPTGKSSKKVVKPQVSTTESPQKESQLDMDAQFMAMENSTFQCSSMVLSCGAGSDILWQDAVPLTDACCENSELDEDHCVKLDLKNAFHHMLSEDGNIYTASPENSIYLLMNPRLDDYTHKIIPGERPAAGFRFYIGVGGDAKSYSKPILITPGSYTLVELTKEETKTVLNKDKGITSLLKPKPPCKHEPDYEYIQWHEYQKWACEADCSVKRDLDVCECTVMEASFRAEDLFCKNVSLRSICKKLISKEKNNPDSAYHRCKTNCSEACEWHTLSAFVTSTSFPAPHKTEALRQALNRGVSQNDTRNFTVDEVKSLALVELYYGSMYVRYTERSERATLNELISNIGGALGVWAGMSLITIWQALIYFILAAKNFLSPSRADRR